MKKNASKGVRALKPEVEEYRKDLVWRVDALERTLATTDDEFLAEELYVVKGELETLLANPDNYVTP